MNSSYVHDCGWPCSTVLHSVSGQTLIDLKYSAVQAPTFVTLEVRPHRQVKSMLCLLQLASVKGCKSIVLVLLSWRQRPVASVPAVGYLLLTLQQANNTNEDWKMPTSRC